MLFAVEYILSWDDRDLCGGTYMSQQDRGVAYCTVPGRNDAVRRGIHPVLG